MPTTLSWLRPLTSPISVPAMNSAHPDTLLAAQQLAQQGGGSLHAALAVVSMAFVASFLVAEVIARLMGSAPL